MSKERKLWFVTRPERDPAFHVDALRVLEEAVGGFPSKWSGEREAHKRYEQLLGEKGFKRNNVSRDGSGGRTWVAMLRTYNYIYLMDGFLHLTKVGQALLRGEKVRENVSKQILNLQIPNDYYLSPRFLPKFSEGFEIRPARFLVRLVMEDELLNYVTKEEITYFCLPAKMDSGLEQVKENILHFRKATDDEQDKIKESISSELDNRRRADSSQRNFEESHSDVANTFMILVDYTGLATYVRGQDLRVTPEQKEQTDKVLKLFEERYPFNYRYVLSLEAFAVNAGLDVDTFKASPYYLLSPATRHSKNTIKVRNLLADYPDIKALSEKEIVSILSQELSEEVSFKFASELQEVRDEVINQDFFKRYLNESNDLRFENKTAEIIKAFGFSVDVRPKPSSRHSEDDRTEIEILVHIDDKNVCIIDAKNYKKSFPLTKMLANYMATEYIPIYQDYQNKTVRYFGYVTVNKFTGANRLIDIKNMAEQNPINVPVDGMMINGKTLLSLLDYCLSNSYTEIQKQQAFLSLFTNSGYDSLLKINLDN